VALFVGEDAQVGDFICQERRIGFGIAFGNTDEDEDAGADGRDLFVRYLYRGPADALYYGQH